MKTGGRAIKIAPCLGDLSFAEGMFPTPYGDVFVRHEKRNGKTYTEKRVPDGIKVIE